MLPAPDQRLIERSRKLVEKICHEIQLNAGWIGFDRFMQLALYCPGLGYYSGPQEKFGEQGDFITAPMMGDLFARCMAEQIAEVLGHVEGGNIYEFGAGDGSLAAGILRALARRNCLPSSYFIIETSADLRQRQQQKLQALDGGIGDRVRWLDQLPQSFTGVIFANELLDAMPCKRFEANRDGSCKELGVTFVDQSLEWKVSQGPQLEMPADVKFAPGYQSERMLQAEAWIRTVGAMLRSGVLLLVDYGFPQTEFYHPDRQQGTLMCHYRHRSHGDPFFWPGLQDITTHVDFTAIAVAGRCAGLEIGGYCDQANFLMSCGLIDILNQLQNDQQSDSLSIMERAAEVKKLIMPHEMGELFKVIALTRNYQSPLMGFSRRNQTNRLGVL